MPSAIQGLELYGFIQPSWICGKQFLCCVRLGSIYPKSTSLIFRFIRFIITDHMMLEATELGLGSVWICYFKPDVIKQKFRLPDFLEPINILALGYSDEPAADPERHKTQRIPLNDLVHYKKL